MNDPSCQINRYCRICCYPHDQYLQAVLDPPFFVFSPSPTVTVLRTTGTVTLMRFRRYFLSSRQANIKDRMMSEQNMVTPQLTYFGVMKVNVRTCTCLLYTSDAADE